MVIEDIGDGAFLDEQAVIARYLEVWDCVSARKSTLEAAIRDARETMEHGKALWLATLGYLAVLEQIGAKLARPNTCFPDRGDFGKRFVAGTIEFGPDPSDTDLGEALWSLRCALSHEYGLRSTRRQQRIFTLTQGSLLIVQPEETWDGSVEKASMIECQTVVSVREVGRYVENLVATVRSESKKSGVVLAPDAHLSNLDLFGGLYS
jgi:hypothetical protein